MSREKIAGVILCGGAGSRIGGRKPMVLLAGRPLVAHVADAIRAQASMLAVVGDPEAASAVGAAALTDPPGVARGPLAGVCAALEWGEREQADWVVVAPCDTPLLPKDLIQKLLAAAGNSQAVYVETADGPQPLVALWRPSLAPRLRAGLAMQHPPVRQQLEGIGAARVRFETPEAFMNVNTPEDLLRAEQLLKGRR